MMRSITLKLVLAFLVVSLTGATLVALFAGRATTTEFDRFRVEQARANFIADVSTYYQSAGSWAGVAQRFRPPGQPPPNQAPPGSEGQPPPPPKQPPPGSNFFALADQNGRIVVPAPPFRPGQQVPPHLLAAGTPIDLDGQTIGTVVSNGPVQLRDPNEARYLARINRALLYAAATGAAIALLVGVFLARTLTRPVRDLTAATEAMAGGELDQTVPVRTRDELGQLAESFNKMSADLARANQLRRQMTADIAHDLRNPLTVLTGYIESLRDGVLGPNATMFEVMHDEARHLQRLVEDLRTLSLADAGELALDRQSISAHYLLEKLAVGYRHQAERQHIDLKLDIEPDLPKIDIDAERMAQVFRNLINNALRYTPTGGQITLLASRSNGGVILAVRDTGPGIDPDQQSRIFDRFYRVDSSREQNEGESGLGLAIAKSIVEAHGGAISADSRPGAGTTIRVVLPV